MVQVADQQGTFPSQSIELLVEQGAIRSFRGITKDQVQPASLDLRLSDEGYSVPGSMLPLPGEQVQVLIERFARRKIDLSQPQTLVRGQVYLVRLQESVNLPPGVAAYANNKSSIGRIDIQTRVICHGSPRYDKIPASYQGELWLEIIPKSFDVQLKAGISLNQAIFYQDRQLLADKQLVALHQQSPLLYRRDGGPVDSSQLKARRIGGGALLLTLDLDQEIVGYVAKKNYRPLSLTSVGGHDPLDYFEPIHRPKDGTLFLSREAFYIFNTYERVVVPPEYAVEMLPYDTSAGEFRAHYAGFFDPGFGYGAQGELGGTPAVLEVRPYEDDLIMRHQQPVCKMAFEKLSEPPEILYGSSKMGSHYAEQQGPALSKYFRRPA